jgi:hypothetical protein
MVIGRVLTNVRICQAVCSGRDLNPGLRLERPAYLSGLYYRSSGMLIFLCPRGPVFSRFMGLGQ